VSPLLPPCSSSLTVFEPRFAMTSSLASAIALIISSMLAFWAYSWVNSQAEVFAAESSSFDSTLANAKMVSLGAAFDLSIPKQSSQLALQDSDYSS
jgi:anti-sigma factor RsiW